MKLLILLPVFAFVQLLSLAQDSLSDIIPEQIYNLPPEAFGVARGSVSISARTELFVGHTYEFSMMSNREDWNLEITTENLNIQWIEESKFMTGGPNVRVTALDTGDCAIYLCMTKKDDRACLLTMKYHASNYPAPPVFIAGIRSGEIIRELNPSAEITCQYDEATGIFEKYPVLSWSAELNGKKYSGTGTHLSKDLINAVNNAPVGEVLKFTVELSENYTGHKNAEAVYLIK